MYAGEPLECTKGPSRRLRDDVPDQFSRATQLKYRPGRMGRHRSTTSGFPTRTMATVLKYESRRRVTGTAVLLVLLSLYLLLILGLFPSIEAAAGSFQDYAEALPPAIQESFAIESITTIEGFLAAEVYQFVWVLLLGLYLAYLGGGMVAGDVETGRIDLLLATPVSRKRAMVETYLAALVPILALNIAMPVVVLGGIIAIDESISLASLVALHALAVPYLLLTAAIGLVLSVLLRRSDLAQRGGLGALSPTRYYAPADILVDGTYDLGGAVLLLVAAALMVVGSAEYFSRMDL